MKKHLFITLIAFSLFALSACEKKVKFSFVDEVAICLASYEIDIQFTQTPIEMFEECELESDDLEDIRSCMEYKEIEYETDSLDDIYRSCVESGQYEYEYMNSGRDD